jgi:phosphopantetheine adenylyltransferase
MSEIGITEDMLKRALKQALVEVLEERREYLRDVLEEVLEDFEMVEDIREVRKADRPRRRSVFTLHEGEA